MLAPCFLVVAVLGKIMIALLKSSTSSSKPRNTNAVLGHAIHAGGSEAISRENLDYVYAVICT